MEDQEVIREQIEQTKSSLTDKLETLEDRVTATVQEASKAVEAVTDTVEGTVATVTDTVQETVETVKDTVQETLTVVKDGVGAIKDIFNIPRHVDRYPWVAVGGSLAVGFLLGEVLLSRSRRHERAAAEPHAHSITPADSSNGHATNGTEASSSGIAGLLSQFAPDLSKLKGLALGVLMGTVREMVSEAAGENLGHSLGEIIDGMTEKIGGTLIPREQIASFAPKTEEHNEDPHEDEAESREPAAMFV